MFRTKPWLVFSMLILIGSGSGLRAYDFVKLEKLVPLVDKKSSPTVLRADPDNQLWILNNANQSLEQIGMDGKATVVLMPGKKPTSMFKEPVDFAFTTMNSIVVADPGLERVAVIGPETKSETAGAKDWKKSKLITSFPAKDVSAVAVSHDGIIAVGYDGQTSIDIYSIDGVLLHRLFPNDKYPFKKITSMAYARNGTLWVLEGSKGVLHRFSPDRKWLGATEGFDGAHGLGVDDFGFAYVCQNPGRWREINPEGTAVGVFGAKGKNPGEMLNPVGPAVINNTDIWVAEASNLRIQKFHVDNKEKTTRLFPDPAAFVQVRFLSQWEDQVAEGIFGANGDILLIRSDGASFEWIDQQGASKSTWKKKGKGNLGFVHPANMGIDSMGKIWVSDRGDHTLKQINETGDVEKTLGQKGKNEGGLKGPSFISLRADGSAVVVDKDNSRVQVLSPNGLFLFAVGSPGKKDGQFSTIAGLGTNADTIAVLDSGRKSLMFFNASGKFVSEVGNKEGRAPYWTDPVSLAADTDGRFYVLDRGSQRVRVFNQRGQFLADFSAKGQRIACGPNQRVLVIDEKTIALYAVRLVPRMVQNMSAADVDGDLQVNWDKNSESTQYAIYRSSVEGSFSLVTKVDAPPFSDRDTTPGVLYTYAVVGVNAAGNEGSWAASKPVKAPKRKDVSLISIQKIDLKPVFTAANKYYVNNPFGTITIRNNDEKSFRGVKLSVGLKKYSDFPTEIVVPEMAAGEEKAVPVTMTFNDKIYELTENTPVQMEIHLSYFEDNIEKGVTQNAPITLYSRNAIAWSDRSRVASFITAKDPPVVDFTRAAIRDQMVLLKGSTVTRPLAKAALFYEAVNALGISYVPDPNSPFSEAVNNPEILDYTQFPRETLIRKTGDCDDTTELMAALLESVGVQVALVDMPGHILLMINTEESDISTIGLPEERFVKFQGTYWVPIETTRFGADFMAAWQSGSANIAGAKDPKSVKYIPVAEAWEKYPPVTLVEAAKDVPAYPANKVAKTFPPILRQLQEDRYQGQLKDVNAKIKADPKDHLLQIQLGMVHVEGGHQEEAQKIFNSLLKEDEPADVRSSAYNNLGNLAYLKADYKAAADAYGKAAAIAPDDGGILINQGRAAWRMGDRGGATKYLEQAEKVLPDWRNYTADIPAELIPKS